MRSLTLNLDTLLVSDEAKLRELRRVEAGYRKQSTAVRTPGTGV